MPRPRKRKHFEAKLFRYPGPGGWTFAPVPDAHAPPVTHGWGRTPVVANVNGRSWSTSVWRDKKYGSLLPVPKHIRGDSGDGHTVMVELSFESAMDDLERPPALVRSKPGHRRGRSVT
jgi:hypothetical protein